MLSISDSCTDTAHGVLAAVRVSSDVPMTLTGSVSSKASAEAQVLVPTIHRVPEAFGPVCWAETSLLPVWES